MASTQSLDRETGKSPKAEQPPPPPPPRFLDCIKVDVAIRVLLVATTLTSIVVMVTSKQTELTSVPITPFRVPLSAKFNDSPAFVYFVVALVVACFYGIITTLASISVILKPAFTIQFTLYFAFLDIVMLGVVASATGTAGGVVYVGLKGNRHVRWSKICDVYDKFCRHVGSSVALSLFASVLLLLLSYLSISSLYKKIRD